MMPLSIAFSLALNILALALNVSVLFLAARLRLVDATRRAQNALLVCTTFWIAVEIAGQVAFAQKAGPEVLAPLAYLSAAAYGLATVGAFSLVVTAAGKMSGPLEVITRAGVAFWLLFQIPLWQGELLAVDTSGPTGAQLQPIGLPGLYVTTILFVYQGLTLWLAHRYRDRIGQPSLIRAVYLFQGGNALMAIFPFFRELGISTWLAGPAALLLGHNLFDRDTLGPLLAQIERIHTLRDAALSLASPSSDDLAARIARQARQLAAADVSLLFTLTATGELEVAACIGENVPVGARMARGQGLAGWVVQHGQPLRVTNYMIWDSGLEGFHRLDFCSALSVPLIYEGRVLGAITIADQDAERRFSDEDQALVEVLALHAAVALHAQLPDGPG